MELGPKREIGHRDTEVTEKRLLWLAFDQQLKDMASLNFNGNESIVAIIDFKK